MHAFNWLVEHIGEILLGVMMIALAIKVGWDFIQDLIEG